MTTLQHPHRTTGTWKLWAIGIIAGLGLSIVALYQGGDDPNATRNAATQIGAWSFRLLAIGAILIGGWGALRRSASR